MTAGGRREAEMATPTRDPVLPPSTLVVYCAGPKVLKKEQKRAHTRKIAPKRTQKRKMSLKKSAQKGSLLKKVILLRKVF